MLTGPVPPALPVTWHFLAIRFGRARRSERPVRVRSFPDPGCVKTPSSKAGRMVFSDRANSTVLRNRHCANCDPRRDLSYRFVASMTAPVASGWSGSPGGPHTHWRVPPFHGAHPKRSLPGFNRNHETCRIREALPEKSGSC